jgi:hypothetical protein
MIGPALTPETHTPQPVKTSALARPSNVPVATTALRALVEVHAALAAPAAPKKLAAPVPPKVRTQVGANSDPRNSGRGST